MKNNKLHKSENDKPERRVWKISKTGIGNDNYFSEINNDLKNIIKNFSHKLFSNNDWPVLKHFLTVLISSLNEDMKIEESVLKLKLNILTKFLYSTSENDFEIIKFYYISEKFQSDEDLSYVLKKVNKYIFNIRSKLFTRIISGMFIIFYQN